MTSYIKSYVLARIDSLERLSESCCKDTSLLELRAILALLNGFEKHDEILAKCGLNPMETKIA